jgi:anti-anti-sigma factor
MSAKSPVVVVSLSGELDIGRKQEVRDALTVDGAQAPLLVDFSEVTYADSTVIAELLRFGNEADREGLRVAIVITSPQFDRLITYAGLRDAFNIFDDSATAQSFLADTPA